MAKIRSIGNPADGRVLIIADSGSDSFLAREIARRMGGGTAKIVNMADIEAAQAQVNQPKTKIDTAYFRAAELKRRRRKTQAWTRRFGHLASNGFVDFSEFSLLVVAEAHYQFDLLQHPDWTRKKWVAVLEEHDEKHGG